MFGISNKIIGRKCCICSNSPFLFKILIPIPYCYKESLAEMTILCYSLSFVVTRCQSMYLSLSLVVSRSEAVSRRCSVKRVFLEIWQNSQKNICARVSFLIKLQAQLFSCEFCQISKSTFSYRTPSVTAS